MTTKPPASNAGTVKDDDLVNHSEPTPSPTRVRDSALRKRSLIEAATVEFAQRGYDGATTRDIAARAGCNESLINRYFGGKRGLLTAVLDDGLENLLEREEALTSSDDVAAEIRQLLLTEMASMWEGRDRVRATMGVLATDPEIGAGIGQLHHNQHLEVFVERLARLHDEGLIRDGVDLEALAFVTKAVAVHLGWFSQIVLSLDRDELRNVAERFAEMLSHGVAASSPPSDGHAPNADGSRPASSPRRL